MTIEIMLLVFATHTDKLQTYCCCLKAAVGSESDGTSSIVSSMGQMLGQGGVSRCKKPKSGRIWGNLETF